MSGKDVNADRALNLVQSSGVYPQDTKPREWYSDRINDFPDRSRLQYIAFCLRYLKDEGLKAPNRKFIVK